MIKTMNPLRSISLAFVLLLAAPFAAGCHGARLETPSGFATLDTTDDYSYRAASAKGVVIAARTESNEVKANTEFWTEALDAKLREKGYVAESSRTVQTAKGFTGSQIRYSADRNGRTHRYWLTVFTTKKKVYVVEAAGDKEVFDKSQKTVDDAISTLDVTP